MQLKGRVIKTIAAVAVAAGVAAPVLPSGLAGAAETTRTHREPAGSLGAGRVSHHTHSCRGLEPDRVVMPNETVDLDASDEVVVVYGPADVEGWYGHQICIYDDPHADYHTVLHLEGDNDDTVLTYTGSSLVYAGDGDDHVYSNADDALVDGEAGNDRIWLGETGAGNVYAGDGNDVVWGSPEGDDINLGNGTDTAWGFGGDDEISGATDVYGGLGWDVLAGENCYDYKGADGADTTNCQNVQLTPAQPGGLQLG